MNMTAEYTSYIRPIAQVKMIVKTNFEHILSLT